MIEIYKTVQNVNPSFMKEIFVQKDIAFNLRNNLLISISKMQTSSCGIESLSFQNLSSTHTAYIIRKAKLKQKSLVITLLDLKNAFGEVHHNLIPKVLQYHHIPLYMQTIIRDLYPNFRTLIVPTSFCTPFIRVGRGVLQGDCLGLLTFNLCFNTFIQYISTPKFAQFGFSANFLYPIQWFHFADDAAVITSLERENQVLLNHFTR